MFRSYSTLAALLCLLITATGIGSPALARGCEFDCCPEDECSAEPSHEETSREVSDKALVQILIHGLSVFHFQPNRDWTERIVVLFPEADGHEMKVYTGEVSNEEAFTWIDQGSFSDSVVTILTDQRLCVTRTGSPADGGIPSNSCEARDARWTLRALDIDNDVVLKSRAANASLFIDGGTLETCALISGPDYTQACLMKKGWPLEKFRRSISEAMVVRIEVAMPKADDDSRAILSVAKRNSPLRTIEAKTTLRNCEINDPEECVSWGKKYYKYVYDVRVSNSVKPPWECTERPMKSKHGKHLKPLFENSTSWGNWEVVGIENQNGYDCQDRQPRCWTHFSKYWKSFTGFSGDHHAESYPLCFMALSNPPACPLVGYP